MNNVNLKSTITIYPVVSKNSTISIIVLKPCSSDLTLKAEVTPKSSSTLASHKHADGEKSTQSAKSWFEISPFSCITRKISLADESSIIVTFFHKIRKLRNCVAKITNNKISQTDYLATSWLTYCDKK